MNAEVLRRAAALMRERAQAATTAAWTVLPGARSNDQVFQPDSDGPHYASWHPAVALAVADWLDYCADTGVPERTALAVARAYLGESS